MKENVDATIKREEESDKNIEMIFGEDLTAANSQTGDANLNLLIKTEEKKLRHTLDLYIIFSFACVILYTIVSFFFTYHTGITLDTLTTCVFACFGGEILCCAVIKRFKLKEENGGGLG